MLTPLLLIGLAAAATAAEPQGRARDGGSLSTIGRPTNTHGHARSSDRVICLRNKARRQNECRKRAEWTKIAESMPRR